MISLSQLSFHVLVALSMGASEIFLPRAKGISRSVSRAIGAVEDPAESVIRIFLDDSYEA